MKKRVLCLVMACCLLLGCGTVLSACQKKGEMALSRKTAEIDLSDYTIVYPDRVNDNAVTTTFKDIVRVFAESISAFSGKNIRAFSQDKTRSKAGDPEILIGLTAREESQKALDSIKGDGYTIQVINNKIVLIGTTNLLTLSAVSYFTENYLVGEAEGKLVLHERATLSNMEMVLLADSEQGYYSFVYGADFDPTLPSDTSYDTTPSGTTAITRYSYKIIEESVTHLVEKLSLKNGKSFTLKDDSTAVNGHEIAVGLTSRPVSQKLMQNLTECEYGIFAEGGNVAVGAWNMKGLIASQAMLTDCMTESAVKEGDKISFVFPASFSLKMSMTNSWKTDFPKPEGLQLYNTAEMTESGLEYLYTGEGVNAAAFDTYCKALQADGFTKTTSNEIEDSLFATFVNTKKKISLYVAYNAFKHAVGSDYAYAQPSLRVISTPLDTAMLPPAELLSYRPYDKKTDSAISATGLPAASSGEGYIITLEDGRFVIIDSGNTKSGTETENFRKALWDLHERNSGAPVSSSNPVRVAAWLITHSHDDHYNIFVEMLKLKGKSGELYVDYVIGNFPCGTELGNTGGDYTMTTKIDEYRSLLRTPFTFIKTHTGQKLYFANMEIETLFTHEDLNPHNIVTFNDSSTIMRLTINVTGGEPVTLMSTGDAYRYAGRWACAMYGTTLRSDMVTMAHHGGPAVEELFYTYVAPTVIWWPHNSRSVHTGYLKQDNRHSLVDQHAYNLPSVKYVYCSGDDHNTTLYLRADGPAYDELYNAGFGTALDYDQYHCIKK